VVDEWVVHDNVNVNSFASYRATTDAPPHLVFDTTLGTSRKAKVFQYDGSTSPYDRLAATTLAEDIDSSETAWDLTSAAEFPTAGAAICESEIITWTGKTSNTLTGVTRAANDTTAATHANGTAISLITLITFQYTTQHLDHGDSHLIKKHKYVFFNTKGVGHSAEMTIAASIDYGAYSDLISFSMDPGGFTLDTSILDTGSLGGGQISLTDVKRISLPASRTISFRATDTQATAQSELYDFDIQVIPKKLKTK
jgi:hypothetical protein